MKFKCGMTKEERLAYSKGKENREAYLKAWHPFYPWWPREVTEGDCRCFEWIERRGYKCWDEWGWEYRLPVK